MKSLDRLKLFLATMEKGNAKLFDNKPVTIELLVKNNMLHIKRHRSIKICRLSEFV